MKKIENFKFGNVDGKNETSQDNFSFSSFFNYQGIYNRLEEGKFLILGNKGTGKTFLLECFKKKKREEGNIFTNIFLDDLFSKKEIIKFNQELLDYNKLFKWIIYIELAKVILALDSINQSNKNVKLLKEFMNKNQFDLNLHTNKIIESSIEKGVKGSLNINKNIFTGFIERIKSSFCKEEYGKYNEYIKHLEEIIIKIIQEEWKSENYIYIIFDELDNINFLDKDMDKILLELIKLSNELNQDWKSKVHIRILIGMRLDIFLKLNASYTNKIKEDSSIVLSWGKEENLESPLMQMIFHKMRVQDESLKDLTDFEISKILFTNSKIKIHGKRIPIIKYILGKTLLKPRDIISFFNKAQFICGDKNYITPKNAQKIANTFSDYLYMELRNQAHGLIDIQLFDEVIKLFKNFRKTFFEYEELENYIIENQEIYKFINKENLKTTLEIFFDIGILGNIKSINDHGSMTYYKYRDDVEINFKENLTIHYGIRPYLKLNIENNLSHN